jgi:hypothetical protein
MDRIDLEKNYEFLVKQSRELQAKEREEKKLSGVEERPPNKGKKLPPREEIKSSNGERLCPLSFSNPNGPINCTPECQLYRTKNVPKGFECTFQELRSTSWYAKEIFNFLVNFARGR